MSGRKPSRRTLPVMSRGIATESLTSTFPPVHRMTGISSRVMARLEFSADVDVKCSPERAFDYFADHRHVPAVLDGVTKWDPIGTKTQGVGARYDVEMEVLGMPLKSVLRLDRWRRPSEIGWGSEAGIVQQEGR